MLAQVFSASLIGLDVHFIKIEIDASSGLPSWDIVGLPDVAVKESKERVHTAIKNAGFDFPPRRIVVNLAPANIRKEGPSFDLPIAIAILSATEQIPIDSLEKYIFIGELGLDGALNSVNGILPIALSQADTNSIIITSMENAQEAAISGITTYGFKNLYDVVCFLQKPDSCIPLTKPNLESILQAAPKTSIDFADIKGQYEAKRALEIAAAGNHNIILIGSPGAGKTMLARAFPSILPPLTINESLETTKIHSCVGLINDENFIITNRPFRAPHHSASLASLIGGGRIPRPGEISLAHNGVLFMDEFPEYKKEVLESLRQPLEDKIVTISRINSQITYPCNFLLIAALNPCPCGYLNDPQKECSCTPSQVSRYLYRISGPLLDRFDIQLEISPITFGDLYDKAKEESSDCIRNRVISARNIQLNRFKSTTLFSNGNMNQKEIKEYCTLNNESKSLLENAFRKLNLSARAHNRILKLARTIADLDNSIDIKRHHLAEAIQYRTFDKKIWR